MVPACDVSDDVIKADAAKTSKTETANRAQRYKDKDSELNE